MNKKCFGYGNWKTELGLCIIITRCDAECFKQTFWFTLLSKEQMYHYNTNQRIPSNFKLKSSSYLGSNKNMSQKS